MYTSTSSYLKPEALAWKRCDITLIDYFTGTELLYYRLTNCIDLASCLGIQKVGDLTWMMSSIAGRRQTSRKSAKALKNRVDEIMTNIKICVTYDASMILYELWRISYSPIIITAFENCFIKRVKSSENSVSLHSHWTLPMVECVLLIGLRPASLFHGGHWPEACGVIQVSSEWWLPIGMSRCNIRPGLINPAC